MSASRAGVPVTLALVYSSRLLQFFRLQTACVPSRNSCPEIHGWPSPAVQLAGSEQSFVEPLPILRAALVSSLSWIVFRGNWAARSRAEVHSAKRIARP